MDKEYKKKDPSNKNKTMFLSDCKDYSKNIFKNIRDILFECGGKKRKARREICVRKDDTKYEGKKEVVEKRRQMTGVSTQFSLHMQSGYSQSSLVDSINFFFVEGGGKKPMHLDKDIDHPSLYCILQENLSFHDKRQCAESAALRQDLAPPWAAPCAQWPIRLLRPRSRLVRSFHLASFRVRFSIRALRSFPHFIISC